MTTTITKKSATAQLESLKLMVKYSKTKYPERMRISAELNELLNELAMDLIPARHYDAEECTLLLHGTALNVIFEEDLVATFSPSEIDTILELSDSLKEAKITRFAFHKEVTSGDVLDAKGYVTLRQLDLVLSDPTDVRVISQDCNGNNERVVFEGQFPEALTFLLQATLKDA